MARVCACLHAYVRFSARQEKERCNSFCHFNRFFLIRSFKNYMEEGDLPPTVPSTNSPPVVVYCSDDDDEACGAAADDPVDDDDRKSDRFLGWWTTVGRTLLDSVHHSDKSVRRNAVQMMMPITHRFPRTEVVHMAVTTPELKRLHELYAAKIVIEERRIQGVVGQWCDRIDQLCRACRQEDERVRLVKKELLQKADRLVSKFGPRVSDIVAEQLTRSAKQLDTERDLRVRIARLEAHSQRCSDARVTSSHVDADIRKTESGLSGRFPPETFGSIKQMYLSHIRNIEHKVAEQIQDRCKSCWLGGLS